jgi:hypothetical protein
LIQIPWLSRIGGGEIASLNVPKKIEPVPSPPLPTFVSDAELGDAADSALISPEKARNISKTFQKLSLLLLKSLAPVPNRLNYPRTESHIHLQRLRIRFVLLN